MLWILFHCFFGLLDLWGRLIVAAEFTGIASLGCSVKFIGNPITVTDIVTLAECVGLGLFRPEVDQLEEKRVSGQAASKHQLISCIPSTTIKNPQYG